MVSKYSKHISDLWQKEGGDFAYYEKAEQNDWTNPFWDKESRYKPVFDQLNLAGDVCEIACGIGRHAERYSESVQGRLWLVDTSAEAIKIAKDRFKSKPNVDTLVLEAGNSLPDIIKDRSLVSVLSYDAMVHFEFDDINSYLKSIFNKLNVGGRALLHHSAYDKNPGGNIHENPGWRNYMSPDLFRHLSQRAGFSIVEQQVFKTAEGENFDCLSLIEKT